MTTEEILRQQIWELTKLLELKDRRIQELEALQGLNKTVFIPSNWTVVDLPNGTKQTEMTTISSSSFELKKGM